VTPTQLIDYDGFNRGDIPHILSQVSPTAVWRQSKMLPWGGEYTGSAGAARFFTKLDAEMETTAFQAKENIEMGDQVFSFGYYEGRSRKTGQTGGAEWMFRGEWRTERLFFLTLTSIRRR